MLSDAQNVKCNESKMKLEKKKFCGRFWEKTKKMTRIAPRYLPYSFIYIYDVSLFKYSWISMFAYYRPLEI